jgi:hypothetical protein
MKKQATHNLLLTFNQVFQPYVGMHILGIFVSRFKSFRMFLTPSKKQHNLIWPRPNFFKLCQEEAFPWLLIQPFRIVESQKLYCLCC